MRLGAHSHGVGSSELRIKSLEIRAELVLGICGIKNADERLVRSGGRHAECYNRIGYFCLGRIEVPLASAKSGSGSAW